MIRADVDSLLDSFTPSPTLTQHIAEIEVVSVSFSPSSEVMVANFLISQRERERYSSPVHTTLLSLKEEKDDESLLLA